MDSKYYTPDISEFFVGFEYEQLVQEKDYFKGWEYRTFTIEKFKGFAENYKEILSRNLLRVKYLDSSDIEELGYFMVMGSKQLEQYANGDNSLFLVYYRLEHKISIAKIVKRDSDLNMPIIEDKNFIVRDIIIKNKSELIKVLKMLQV